MKIFFTTNWKEKVQEPGISQESNTVFARSVLQRKKSEEGTRERETERGRVSEGWSCEREIICCFLVFERLGKRKCSRDRKIRRLRSICWKEKLIKDQKKLSDSDWLENVTVEMSWLSLYLFKLFSNLKSQVFPHYLFKLFLNLSP